MMKTKVVYCLVSCDQDYYLEQVYISVLSLREHTNDVTICLIVDEDTANSKSAFRKKIFGMFDELITVTIDNSYTNAEKSRYLKTTARLHIEGPCLFVDTDTIFTDDISDIDSFFSMDTDICAVLDSHGLFKDMVLMPLQVERSQKVGWGDIINDEYHFNSGVIFAKDTLSARSFYEEWNKNWEYERKFNLFYDQIALAKTCRDKKNQIKEMDGIWNCQIFSDGIKFLSHAKIIHYFWGGPKKSPYLFKNQDIYDQIKKEERIPEFLLPYIKDGRSAFVGHSTICETNELKYLRTNMCTLSIIHPKFFSVLDKFVKPYISLRIYIHELRGKHK